MLEGRTLSQAPIDDKHATLGSYLLDATETMIEGHRDGAAEPGNDVLQ